ncbi:MAG TPA: GNAT family N-acetyltransferase [Candidatus Binatia bacterium]|jgi:RimJ/RimL family protein N-acetyltransferase|nr:GNAT family N-acetyltransferase [Candidatus Binatia bacterium]
MDEFAMRREQQAIRALLDERQPADALAVYYALHHPRERTQLFTHSGAAGRTDAYVALSRTGIDLFRPLLTLRLDESDPEGAADLIHRALPPEADVFIHSPVSYRPLLAALFEIKAEQLLRLYRLDAARFEPVINVLVMRSDTPDGLPRYIIRPTSGMGAQEIGASATLNWQSSRYAEVTVYTNPQYRQRGWGRSVVSALVQDLLESGKTPLYEVAPQNEASVHLAEALGFTDTGADKLFLEARLRSRP